jgi:hypothetical protein
MVREKFINPGRAHKRKVRRYNLTQAVLLLKTVHTGSGLEIRNNLTV